MGLSQKSLAQIKKIFLFSLERLEGKTGEGPFFKVRSDRITVWAGFMQGQHVRKSKDSLGTKVIHSKVFLEMKRDIIYAWAATKET